MSDSWWKKAGLGETDVQSMSSGARKAFKSMSAKIEANRQRDSLSIGVGDVSDSMIKTADLLKHRYEEAQKAMANFAKSGYGLADGTSGLSEAMSSAISLTDTFLHSTKAGSEAMRGLSQSLDSGQFEAFTKTIGISTGALAANAASLHTLGLNMRNFGKNIDMMVYSFNQGQDEVVSFNQNLFEFAKTVKQLPNVVSQNFQLVAKSLAYSFPKIQTEFIKIQEMAAKTGVSVNKLMGTFGQQSDTIGGASSFASGLNTILGKNVFSATKVLMMSEAERMEATRNALKESQIYEDYTRGDERLKKFALRAISGKIGMSLDETRRFLDGGETGTSVKSKMSKEISGQFDHNREKFNKGLKNLTKSLQSNANLINELTRTRTERDLAIVGTDRKLAISPISGHTPRKALKALGPTSPRKQSLTGFFTGEVGSTGIKGENAVRKVQVSASNAHRAGLLNTLRDTMLAVTAEPNLQEAFKEYYEDPGPNGFGAQIKSKPGLAHQRLLQLQKSTAAPGEDGLSSASGRADDTRLDLAQLRTINSMPKDSVQRARLLGQYRERAMIKRSKNPNQDKLDKLESLNKAINAAEKPLGESGGASISPLSDSTAHITIKIGEDTIVSKALAQLVATHFA
jgi:DNA-binding transcriptional MerR regulator